MRAKAILVVGIALFVASCVSLTSKPVQSPAPPDSMHALKDGGGAGQGLGSERQGPSLDGTSAPSDERATGLEADAVRVVGGQLVTGAPQ